MATKNITYRVLINNEWVDAYFKTSAAQVGESSTLKFMRPATHTVNGESFFDSSGNAKAITLYGTNISATSDADAPTITDMIDSLEGSINTLTGSLSGKADSVHSHDAASQTADGFMSKTDKKRLDDIYALWGSGQDADNLVNTVSEVLAIFDKYPEGKKIVDSLSTKLDTEYGGTISADVTFDTGTTLTVDGLLVKSDLTVDCLSTFQAEAEFKYDIIVRGDATFDGYVKTNKLHIPTTSNGTTYGVGSNGQVLMSNGTSVYWGTVNVDLANVRKIYEGSTTPTGASNGDIWLQYS